jgi:hypothetical protein
MDNEHDPRGSYAAAVFMMVIVLFLAVHRGPV